MTHTDLRLGQIIHCSIIGNRIDPVSIFHITDEKMAMRLKEFRDQQLGGEDNDKGMGST